MSAICEYARGEKAQNRVAWVGETINKIGRVVIFFLRKRRGGGVARVGLRKNKQTKRGLNIYAQRRQWGGRKASWDG